MRKVFLIAVLLFAFASSGCSANSGGENTQLEQIEGYEGLSDEETNQKLIQEADQMEVVPDKK